MVDIGERVAGKNFGQNRKFSMAVRASFANDKMLITRPTTQSSPSL
jgi:hypothetical protein